MYTKLSAKCVIITVSVFAKIAICVCKFAMQDNASSAQNLAGEELDVALLGQSLRFCEIGAQLLNLRE